jgi:hypothetical protein
VLFLLIEWEDLHENYGALKASEKERYDVFIKCGERMLLPAVKSALKDALIIPDGYSCRGKLLKLPTGRRCT